jgi:hypothetical protein
VRPCETAREIATAACEHDEDEHSECAGDRNGLWTVISENFGDLRFRYECLHNARDKKPQDQCPQDFPKHGESHVQSMSGLLHDIHRITLG